MSKSRSKSSDRFKSIQVDLHDALIATHQTNGSRALIELSQLDWNPTQINQYKWNLNLIIVTQTELFSLVFFIQLFTLAIVVDLTN